MTEYSRNSNKMNQPETVSQTNPRSNIHNQNTNSQNKGSPTQSKYSDHGSQKSGYHGSQKSGYQDGESRSETLPTQLGNIDLSIQNIMPLICCMKDQNEHLKVQRQMMQKQMNMVQSLSKDLLLENEGMRKHYCQRTHDISKLIESITINTNEDITDLKHQAHLIKESNVIIVKQIEQQIKHIKEAQLALKHKSQALAEVHQQRRTHQQNANDLNIHNQQLFHKCQQITIFLQNDHSQDIEYQVNQLNIKVAQIKQNNIKNIYTAKDLKYKNSEEKPQFQEYQTHIVKSIKQLQLEVRDLNENSISFQNKLEASMENSQKCQKKFTEQKGLFQKYKQITEEQFQEHQMLERRKRALLQKGKVNSAMIEKQIEQKHLLERQIQQKKQKIKDKQQQFKSKKEQLSLFCQQNIKKMKKNLNNQIQKANGELLEQLNPESANIELQISQRKDEFACLVQQIDELRNNIKRLDNPMKEVIRLEYQLKKQANKRLK